MIKKINMSQVIFSVIYTAILLGSCYGLGSLLNESTLPATTTPFVLKGTALLIGGIKYVMPIIVAYFTSYDVYKATLILTKQGKEMIKEPLFWKIQGVNISLLFLGTLRLIARSASIFIVCQLVYYVEVESTSLLVPGQHLPLLHIAVVLIMLSCVLQMTVGLVKSMTNRLQVTELVYIGMKLLVDVMTLAISEEIITRQTTVFDYEIVIYGLLGLALVSGGSRLIKACVIKRFIYQRLPLVDPQKYTLVYKGSSEQILDTFSSHFNIEETTRIPLDVKRLSTEHYAILGDETTTTDKHIHSEKWFHVTVTFSYWMLWPDLTVTFPITQVAPSETDRTPVEKLLERFIPKKKLVYLENRGIGTEVETNLEGASEND